jgi:hypothetical protein
MHINVSVAVIGLISLLSSCKAPIFNVDNSLEKKVVKEGCSKGLPLSRMSTIEGEESTLIVFHSNYCSKDQSKDSKARTAELSLQNTQSSSTRDKPYVGTYIQVGYDPRQDNLVGTNRAAMSRIMEQKGFRVVTVKSNDPTGWQREIEQDRKSNPQYYGPNSSVFAEVTTHGIAKKAPEGKVGGTMVSVGSGERRSINAFDGVKSVMDAVGGDVKCTVFMTQCHAGALKSDPRFSDLMYGGVNPKQQRAILFSSGAHETARVAQLPNGRGFNGITTPMLVLLNESSKGDVTQTDLERAWSANPGWTVKTAYRLSEHPADDGKRYTEAYKKFVDQHPTVISNTDNMILMPKTSGQYNPDLRKQLLDKKTAEEQWIKKNNSEGSFLSQP